jgi:hypothetical protein
LIVRILVVIVAAVCGGSLLAAPPARQSDLDAFMARVLERRDQNWKKLQQYVLDERQFVQVRGPAALPVWGERREYAWYIREGFFVRSPVKVNGVQVPDDERQKYETDYLRRVKARDERDEAGRRQAGQRAEGQAEQRAEGRGQRSDGLQDLIVQTRQPEFVDTAYFLKFKFEEGKYAFVGRETFEGRDVLRIEYYPTRLFSHEADDQRQRRREGRTDREEDAEATMERLMNKVSLVTLWVEPIAHQIVKYTFDNVNLDFLPAAWLVRVTDMKATMTMGEAFPDVWLPRDVDMFVGAMLAIGSFTVNYQVDYHDYQEATTSGRIKGSGGGAGGR